MESDLSYWIILVACLLLSAMFSAAETSLTSLPEAYIRKLIEEKRVLIKPFQLWLNKPNRVLTTIIVGNNLVNTLAAVVADNLVGHGKIRTTKPHFETALNQNAFFFNQFANISFG